MMDNYFGTTGYAAQIEEARRQRDNALKDAKFWKSMFVLTAVLWAGSEILLWII